MGESRLGRRSVNISQGKAAITMKLLGFLLLLPLVISSPIQDEKVEASVDEKQLMIELVEHLFNSDRDSRELEVDLEDGEGEAAEDLGENIVEEEEKSLSSLVKEENPAEIERFNAYQDAVLRRINAALKAKLMDPMVLNLNGKKSKKSKKERKAKGLKKGKREGKSLTEDDEEVEEVEEVEEEEEAGEERAMKKKEKKKGGMKGKGKKKKNNNKGGKLSAEEKKAKAEEKKARTEARKSKHKDRKNKKHGGKNKGGKKGKDEEMLARSRRNKHSRSDKKGKKEKEDFTEGKTLATLSGIATLRRTGDVEVMNAENHKIVKSKFNVGPLQLEVKKTVGKGKGRSVKTAKAITEKLSGKIVIKVKPDGTSHVRSVVFMKPEEVDVRGTLGDKKRSDLFLKRSIGQVRPVAAQRVLKMARYVMKSPSTVERS